MPAISLMSERRYLLADGVERWRATQVEAPGRRRWAAAGDDLTVVLVARGKAPKGLAEAVEKVGGEVLSYGAPSRASCPPGSAEAARSRGFQLTAQAARALVDAARRGHRATLDRARSARALGRGGRPDRRRGGRGADRRHLRAGRAGRSATRSSPATRAEAVTAADALLDQGEAVTPMIYGMASRLRSAQLAATGLEAGRPAKEVEASLPMAPYPSKMLVRSVQRRLAGGARGGDRRDRRPRVVDPRRLRLRRAGWRSRSPSARRPARSARALEPGGGAPARARRPDAELRAARSSCARPCWRASRPSGPPCRSARPAAGAPLRSASASPSSTAASSRRKCVLTTRRQAPVLDPLALGAKDPLLL